MTSIDTSSTMVRENNSKHQEKSRMVEQNFLATGLEYAVRFFDPGSIEDQLYLHRIMMSKTVQERMSGMDIVDHWKDRWGESARTYVDEDLREWMRNEEGSYLFAVAKKPEPGDDYKSEVVGFVYLYDTELDEEMLKKMKAIDDDFDGTIMETSSAKYENGPKGIGIEGRILALEVYKDMYLQSHPGARPPVFVTQVSYDNEPAIKSVIATGYEEIGEFQPTFEPDEIPDEEDKKLQKIFKLNWDTHSQMLERLHQKTS